MTKKRTAICCKHLIALWLIMALPAALLYSQTKTITGVIRDAVSGTVLPAVSVSVKNSTATTLTNEQGRFSISASKGAVLVITYVGYAQEEITVGDETQININLKVDAKGLGEVVVIGYGSQVKREVTGSVQNINAQELKDIPASQMTQKLQGKLAGVQIYQTTGKPGQGMSVRVRGQLSVSAGSDPLYVVDGLPITGNISNLNPDEIENISVLKDAASTSLYGSRAANGVVLVTTKRAKKGQTNVSLDVYGGLQEVPKKGRIEMMDAVEFAQFKKEYYEDAGQPVPVEFQNPSQYEGKNNDWYDALLRKAPIQSYSLSITSSGEKLSTSIVAGVFNQDGVVLNNTYKRYSFRMNTEYALSDNFKIGFNIAPSHIFDNTPRTDGDRGTGILFNALHTWPVMPIRDANGELTLYNTFPGSTGNIYNYPNWVRAADELVNETRLNNFIGNAYVQYSPIKGLT
ncbi:MAG: SusC/RagA family TonB-linked outer membrane protein, partial [Agriterribacter sp.]